MKQEDFKIRYLRSVSNNVVLRQFFPDDDVCHFIACQFALESSFGTSKLAIYRHNHSGMKKAKMRVTYNSYSGDLYNDDFACYSSLTGCIVDYISWVLYNRPNNYQIYWLDGFKKFILDKGYCPSKDYINSIEKIYSSYYVDDKID